jgi:hypothetical protein
VAYLDDLKTQRDSLVAAMTKAIAAGPNHEVHDDNGGRTIYSADYIKTLTEQIAAVNKLIIAASPSIRVNRAYYNG